VPEAPRRFPTSAVIATISSSVAAAALMVTAVVLHSAAELYDNAVEAEAFSARLVTTLGPGTASRRKFRGV
jgi:hypothetical protein